METNGTLIAKMDVASCGVRFQLYGQTYHAFDNPEAGIDPNARLAIHSRLHSTPTDC